MKLLLLIPFILTIHTGLIAQENLLKNKNPECNGTYNYTFSSSTKYTSAHTNTKDGSGSFMFTGQGSTFLSNNIKTDKVYLIAGRRYEMRAYIKMTNTSDGQNILLKVTKNDGSNPGEMLWNMNKPNEWEEVILPYIALSTGTHSFTILAWPKYMLTTDGQYGQPNGSNLALCPTVYIDDFSVIEMRDEQILSSEPETPKSSFNSEYIKVDAEGNYMVKENGAWKNIFPRLAYQSWHGNFAQESARMSEYGFNGWANIDSLWKLKTALQNGMIYNSIQINDLEPLKPFIKKVVNQIQNGDVPKSSIISYLIDNEMTALCNYSKYKLYGAWIDKNDTDVATNRRARPVLLFNGQAEGVARAYINSNNNLMNITGSYISRSGEEEDFRYNPTSNISLLRNTHKQTAPVVFFDVQAYFHNAFTPSIFKGIINGAKGLVFWRGGTNYKGSQMDFRNNVWATSIKGSDGVFARIDSMLTPIITQPLSTPWTAAISSEDRQTIAIGTRDNQATGKHYIIMANFSDKDQHVEVNLERIRISKIKDFFSQKEIVTIKGQKLSINIGHFNNGYLVLELTGTVTPNAAPNESSKLIDITES